MPDVVAGTKYLDPEALVKLKNLGLAARLVVEGLFSGQHRSPHKGFSVEFAEHRQYAQGDEPRYLDWKLLTKLEYACFCTASLAYLMQSQHDSYGLLDCDTKVRTNVPPRQGKGHLHAVMEALEHVEPGGETDLAGTFHELAERIQRRALVIVLSDLLGSDPNPQPLLDALGHLRHRKHEVVVLQLLDPAELKF